MFDALTRRLIARLRPWFSQPLLRAHGALPLTVESTVQIALSPVDHGWRAVAEDGDPQMLLSGLPHVMTRFGPAVLKMDARLDDGQALIGPVLYLDRGKGFTEDDRIPFIVTGEGLWETYIRDLRGLRRLRLDPSEGATAFTLDSLSIRRAVDADDGLLRSMDAVGVAPKLELPGVEMRGLQLESLLAIDASDGGVLRLLGDDPQMVFNLLPLGETGAAVARVTLRFEAVSELIAPRAYVAYRGGGFEYESSFPLQPQPDGSHQLTVALPALGARVRWDPSEEAGELRLLSVIAEAESLADAGDYAVDGVSTAGLRISVPKTLDLDETTAWRLQAMALTLKLNEEGLNHNPTMGQDYPRWLQTFGIVSSEDYVQIDEMLSRMTPLPKFSFVMPTYNTPPRLLQECVSSLLRQVYPNFEICIADDSSTDLETPALLQRLAAMDPRIKVRLRSENGHISAASNSALEMATGEYVVLVDHDDLIPPYTLAVIAAYIHKHPDAEVLYSDEDKLSPRGDLVEPYFKSAFNEYLMFGHNMVSHIGVYRRALIEAIGGFRLGYEGSQDYDLLLRCLDRCGASKIVHIPHVLYHWRIIPGSTAMSADQKSYAIDAAQRCLNDHFDRRGLPYRSVDGSAPGLSSLAMQPLKTRAKISVVIPTRDQLDLLQLCIDSIRARADEAVEIVVIDNGSVEVATLDYLNALERDGVAVVLRAPGAFNFSRLCNLGVEASSGEIICLLNNDTEVLADDWLERARGHLSAPDVGIVGARLLYPDRTVQHFGLYLGLGAHRIAGTPHRGLAEHAFGYFGKARLIQEFSAVTAACLFVRRADYLSVGGFDEALAVAYNDVDFCLKLRAKNLKVICDPGIVLIHKESKTRGADTDQEKAERLEREAALMRDRWGPVLDNDPYYSPNLTRVTADMGLAAPPRVDFPWRWPAEDEAALNP